MLTYCGNHFTIYLSQIVILYTLNLYSVVCPCVSIKLGGKKNNLKIKKKFLTEKRNYRLLPSTQSPLGMEPTNLHHNEFPQVIPVICYLRTTAVTQTPTQVYSLPSAQFLLVK